MADGGRVNWVQCIVWCVGVARRPNECGKLLCMSPLCVRLRRSAIDHVCQAALGNITYQPAAAAASRLPLFPLPPPLLVALLSAAASACCACQHILQFF